MTLTKDIKNQEAFFIRLDILEITRFPKSKPILLSDTNTNYWLDLHTGNSNPTSKVFLIQNPDLTSVTTLHPPHCQAWKDSDNLRFVRLVATKMGMRYREVPTDHMVRLLDLQLLHSHLDVADLVFLHKLKISQWLLTAWLSSLRWTWGSSDPPDLGLNCTYFLQNQF